LPQSLPLRPAALALACAVLAVVLASCGSGSSGSSSTGSTSTQAAQGRRPFGGIAADPKIRACLQKQGVTLPARPNRPGGSGGPPPGGGAPGYGQPPGGGPPPGGRRPGQGFAQNPKLQKALKACGVTLPAPGQGGPAGTSPSQTTS
jgi:hypothetical protein